MANYTSFCDNSSSSGFNPNLQNIGASNSNGGLRGGLSPSSSRSMVFESDKGELVKFPASATANKVEKNKISEAKALAALKSHSEAERRRRERINGHLATLRGLVPCTEKMDKATLLREVIRQVKELEKKAGEASKGLLIPMDSDEVKVEPCDNGAGNESISYMATVCCDYQSEILSDLRQTLDALQLQLVKSEFSTLGERMKNVFVYICCKRGIMNIETCQAIASNVHQALGSVLEKASNALEFSIRASDRSKRRRLCFIESSTSSCNHEFCSY